MHDCGIKYNIVKTGLQKWYSLKLGGLFNHLHDDVVHTGPETDHCILIVIKQTCVS